MPEKRNAEVSSHDGYGSKRARTEYSHQKAKQNDPSPAPGVMTKVSSDKITKGDHPLPANRVFAQIPSYNSQTPLSQPKDRLPPLPPIRDPQLEAATFTHNSLANQFSSHTSNYDQLEFLGDAYIEIIATRLIFARYPSLPTGQQAQLRESIVKNKTLAEYSRGYGFDKRVRMTANNGIERDAWTKVQADVFEAYVAAVILSDPTDGFKNVEEWLTALWTPKLPKQKEVQSSELARPGENPKDVLLRLVVSKDVKVLYEETAPRTQGHGHTTYYIGCYLNGGSWNRRFLGSGEGQSKTLAGLAAAADALEKNKAVIEEAAKKKSDEAAERKARMEAAKAAEGSDEHGK